MPTKKRTKTLNRDTSSKKRLRLCAHCSKSVTNIATHIDKSKDCREYYFSNNQICATITLIDQNDHNKNTSKTTTYSKFKDRHPTYFNHATIQPAASEIILGNYTPINEMSFEPDNDVINQPNYDASVSHVDTNTNLLISPSNDYSVISKTMHAKLQDTTIDIPTLLNLVVYIL